MDGCLISSLFISGMERMFFPVYMMKRRLPCWNKYKKISKTITAIANNLFSFFSCYSLFIILRRKKLFLLEISPEVSLYPKHHLLHRSLFQSLHLLHRHPDTYYCYL